MEPVSDEAIVIRRRPSKEWDLSVTLFALEQGKLTATARGARRPASKLGPSLQPFCRNEVVLRRYGERSHTCALLKSRCLESNQKIAVDMLGFSVAAVLAEAVEAGTEWWHPQPELYNALAEALRRIGNGGRELVGVRFLVELLADLGFGLHLEHCSACGKESTAPAFLSPSDGGILCSDCAGKRPPLKMLPPEALRFLHGIHDTSAGEIPEDALPVVVSRVLFGALGDLCRWHFEAPLRSLDFWRKRVSELG